MSLSAIGERFAFYKNNTDGASSNNEYGFEKSLNMSFPGKTNANPLSNNTIFFSSSTFSSAASSNASKSYFLPSALSNFMSKAPQPSSRFPNADASGALSYHYGGSKTFVHTLKGSTPNGVLPPSNSLFSCSTDIESQRSTENEEAENLISSYAKKGLNVVKNSASALTGSARTVVSNAQDTLNDSPLSFTFNPHKLIYFSVAAFVGFVFMSLAFMILPTIIFAPSKFALLFTFGSLSWLMSLGFLKGFKALAKHLISVQRLPYSIAYILSLILTLYSTLFIKSYILAFLFSIIQIVVLISVLVSYIPGGPSALRFVGEGACRFAKSSIRIPSFFKRNENVLGI